MLTSADGGLGADSEMSWRIHMGFLEREQEHVVSERKSSDKHAYSTPRVTRYGSVVQLTQGGVSTSLDGGSGNLGNRSGH